MKAQIAMFKLTLGNGQSIGPAALLAFWRHACQTPHVSVSRQAGAFGADNKPTYSLYASQQLENLALVESRLRQSLDGAHLRASLIPLHA